MTQKYHDEIMKFMDSIKKQVEEFDQAHGGEISTVFLMTAPDHRVYPSVAIEHDSSEKVINWINHMVFDVMFNQAIERHMKKTVAVVMGPKEKEEAPTEH